MKEDYLWNKTGDDAEIRRLEESLAVFRHEPDAAPLLPVHQSAVAEVVSKPSWTLWLRLAFAGSAAAFVAVAVGIWAVQEREVSQTTSHDIERPVVVQPEPDIAVPEKAEKLDAAPGSEIAARPIKEFERPALARPVSIRRTLAASRKTAARSSSPPLTREEKYAYERLMLALSITSSKLKIVRDTIDGKTIESDADRSEKR